MTPRTPPKYWARLQSAAALRKQALPRVPMRIDKARQYDHIVAVDLARVHRTEIRRDRSDLGAFNQNIGIQMFADCRVHRDDDCISYDRAVHFDAYLFTQFCRVREMQRASVIGNIREILVYIMCYFKILR
jgi:hypothetical protein